MRHALLQPLPADEERGFHQRARDVAQEHPIDRKVNVGLEAGGIEEHLARIHRLEQRERLEQLRALELGMILWSAVLDEAPISVDNPADLERARAHARRMGDLA